MKKSILSLSATVMLLASCGGGMSFEDAAKWVETHYVGEQQVIVNKVKWDWDFSMANGAAARYFAVQMITQQTGYPVTKYDDLKKSIEIDVSLINNKLTVTSFRNNYDPSKHANMKFTYKVDQDSLSVSIERSENPEGGSITVIGSDNFDKNGFKSSTETKFPRCSFPDDSNCNNAFIKQTFIF